MFQKEVLSPRRRVVTSANASCARKDGRHAKFNHEAGAHRSRRRNARELSIVTSVQNVTRMWGDRAISERKTSEDIKDASLNKLFASSLGGSNRLSRRAVGVEWAARSAHQRSSSAPFDRREKKKQKSNAVKYRNRSGGGLRGLHQQCDTATNSGAPGNRGGGGASGFVPVRRITSPFRPKRRGHFLFAAGALFDASTNIIHE